MCGDGPAYALPIIQGAAEGFVHQQVDAGLGAGFDEGGFFVVDQAF